MYGLTVCIEVCNAPAMITEKCTYADCGKQFTKPSKARAIQAMKMHINRVHTHTVPTYRGPQKKTKLRLLTDAPAPEKPAQKKWTRRTKTVQAITVNHCPQCGCNIQAVALAMAVANGIN